MAGGVGIPFEYSDLDDKLKLVVEMPKQQRLDWGRRAMERVAERYSWEAVTDRYETLLLRLRG